jgi:hypothetical protein
MAAECPRVFADPWWLLLVLTVLLLIFAGVDSQSQTALSFTGSPQPYTVSAGYTIQVSLWGAAGGGGQDLSAHTGG